MAEHSRTRSRRLSLNAAAQARTNRTPAMVPRL